MIDKTPETKTSRVESEPSTQAGSQRYTTGLFKFTSPPNGKDDDKKVHQEEMLSTNEFLSIVAAGKDNLNDRSVEEKLGFSKYSDLNISDQMTDDTGPLNVGYSGSVAASSAATGASISPNRVTEMRSTAVNHLSYVNPTFIGLWPANSYPHSVSLEVEMQAHIESVAIANTEQPITTLLKKDLYQFFSEHLSGPNEITKGKASTATLSRSVGVAQNEFFQKRYSVLEINGRIIVRVRDFFLTETASTQLFDQLQKFCDANQISKLTITLNGITKTLKGV